MSGARPLDPSHRRATATSTRVRDPPRLRTQALVVVAVPVLFWALTNPMVALTAVAAAALAAAVTAVAMTRRHRRRAPRRASPTE